MVSLHVPEFRFRFLSRILVKVKVSLAKITHTLQIQGVDTRSRRKDGKKIRNKKQERKAKGRSETRRQLPQICWFLWNRGSPARCGLFPWVWLIHSQTLTRFIYLFIFLAFLPLHSFFPFSGMGIPEQRYYYDENRRYKYRKIWWI